MDHLSDRGSLILSVNRGLLGVVGSNWRAVQARANDQQLWLRLYHDGEPTEADRESLGFVGAEVIADFPKHLRIEEEIIRLDWPGRVPHDEDWVTVYCRREPR